MGVFLFSRIFKQFRHSKRPHGGVVEKCAKIILETG